MKTKYVTVKKIFIYENAPVFTSHHSIHIEVDFKTKLEKIEDLKERFKTAFSDIFTDPAVELTIEV